jgi:hypothetical protein
MLKAVATSERHAVFVSSFCLEALVSECVARTYTQAASGRWMDHFTGTDGPDHAAVRDRSRLTWLPRVPAGRADDRHGIQPVVLDSSVISLLLPDDAAASNLNRLLTTTEARPKTEVLGDALSTLLVHWSDLADQAALPLPLATANAIEELGATPALRAMATAQRVSRAAREVRSAVLTGDSDESVEDRWARVADFARSWLGFRKLTPPLVDATLNALLDVDLDGFDPDDDDGLRQHLRAVTCDQHHLLRPIGETQLCGRTVAYLDQPVGLTGGDRFAATISDGIASPGHGLVDAIGWKDPRIDRVLAQLRPDERRLAAAYADDGTLTWRQCAVACGLPDSYGERVRRKLVRVGDRISQRLAARDATRNRAA